MYANAISTAKNLVETLARTALTDSRVESVRRQVVQTGGAVLAPAQQVGTDIAGFATHTLGVLRGLITTLGKGTGPEVVVDSLHRIGAELEAERAKLNPVVAQLGAFRDALSGDVSALTKQQEQLRAQLSSLAAKRQFWASRASKVHTQDTITKIVGIFVPFVPKAASEIASEIQYGKSTEAALNEAEHELATVGTRAQSLQSVINAGSQLSGTLGHLTTASQNLSNAASLLSADLTNDAAKAAAADTATMVLFLQSLVSGVEMLRTGAS